MNTTTIVITLVAAIAVILIVSGLVWFSSRRLRLARLRKQFGPEYDHTVQVMGDEQKAIFELEDRQRRVAELDIKPLSPEDRDHYLSEWRRIQGAFVDDPTRAVTDADRLIQEVMKARSYPVSDFEQQAAYLSVDHPQVVSNYRAAHEIAVRNAQEKADTEDLRRAMIYYRSLFQDLLETENEEEKPKPPANKPELEVMK